MSKKIRALVVEDDIEIQDEIKDELSALGHEHDWAGSQSEARDLLETENYDYALVDLEIPARPGRGFAKIDYGRKVVEQIQQIKGRAQLPVIIMTAHHEKALNLTRELLDKGAVEFISKPFGDAAHGKSLSQIIPLVLKKHHQTYPPGTLPGDPPEEFRGGTLAFYQNHIELNGETILDAETPGHAWNLLQVLRTPTKTGKLPRLGASRLARAIDPTGQISDGAITSCIHTLRTKITQIMLEEQNTVVSSEDVITNKGNGYHFAKWIAIENHDNTPTGKSENTPNLIIQRQQWVLAQLRKGQKLTRLDVEAKFDIGRRQAVRTLRELTKSNKIKFQAKPFPGHYVLVT